MNWLLDVNALIAALFSGHEHHARVTRWVAGLPAGDGLATCSITELGFVRVLNQAPQYRVPVREAVKTLRRFRQWGQRAVVILPDGRGAGELPDWVKAGRQVTDGHLLGLAQAHDAQLATLDESIPGAFLIPRQS